MPITNAMPAICEIARQTYCINEFSLNAMFLLVGTEKALLVDTGTGVFHLPNLLATLTDKPIEVVLTHGHVDHAGGAGWFDTLRMHPADFAQASGVTFNQRKGYANGMVRCPGCPVTVEDTVEFSRFPEMQALQEGVVFDLGGRQVVVYDTPGHTPGGLSFLDVRERILLSGDACNINTLVLNLGQTQPGLSVEALLGTAEKLVRLEPFYDRHYNGHIGWDGSGTFLPQAYSVARDMENLCRDILQGREQGEVSELMIPGFQPISSFYARRGAAGVRYTEKTLRD